MSHEDRRRATADVAIKTYVDALVAPWIERMRAGDITLREYFEAVLREMRTATATATDEREKAAQALAAALRAQVEQGDDRLHEHVRQQVEQIRAALVAADLLETARVEAVIALTESVRRELELAQHASALAVAKAETATEKRFASVNEFREQLATVIQGFMPREVAEKETKAIADRLAALESNTVRRDDYDTRHAELQRRLTVGETWRANVTGRAVGLSVVGGLFVAVATAMVTHLVH